MHILERTYSGTTNRFGRGVIHNYGFGDNTGFHTIHDIPSGMLLHVTSNDMIFRDIYVDINVLEFGSVLKCSRCLQVFLVQC